jgi:peroxiredoxin
MSDIQSVFPGQPVPELDLPIAGGGRLTAATFAGHDFTLLVFYRGAWSRPCRSQLTDLQARQDRFAAVRTQVVAISCDGERATRRLKEELSLPSLDIACGLDPAAARRWGLFLSRLPIDGGDHRVVVEPGMFLVRDDGVLYASWIQSNPYSRVTFDELLMMIENTSDPHQRPRGDVLSIAPFGASAR